MPADLTGDDVGTPELTRRAPAYGMCTHCGSVEVALDNVSGHRDLSSIGESDHYPTGYGCELCS